MLSCFDYVYLNLIVPLTPVSILQRYTIEPSLNSPLNRSKTMMSRNAGNNTQTT